MKIRFIQQVGDSGGLGTGSTAKAPYCIEVTIPGLGDSWSYNPNRASTQTCPVGYTNNGSNFSKTTVRNNIGYGCESGSDYNGGCYIQTGFASCPSGYALQPDRTCKRKTGDLTYLCDSGFYLSGDKCYRTQTASITYTCYTGTLNGTICEIPAPEGC